MTTNPALAPDTARQFETKGAAAPRAPAGDPTQALVDRIDRSTATIGNRIAVLEAKQMLDERKSRALHELRQTNDDKHQRRQADPLIDQKMRNINADIDATERAELERLRRENRDLLRKSLRPHGPMLAKSGPGLGGPARAKQLLREASLNYLRTGETSYKGRNIRDYERAVFGPDGGKGMHQGTGADGGFLVVPEQDAGPIERLMAQYVTMRQHCMVRTINTSSYKKPVRTSTGGALWGNDLNSGGVTNAPKYALLDYPAQSLYAEPVVANELVEDSMYDIETEIADGCLEDFSVAEAVGFTSGSGAERPYGFLGYASSQYVANASWTFGNIGYLATGASGAFPTSSGSVGSADPILTMEFALKQQYRQNAKFMMNRGTIGVCRTLKDAQGHYVWIQADLARGVPATLSGREVIENEQMPDIAANSFSVALADWQRFYIIVDRVGMSVLRDPYSQYPSIAFKTRKRVGGGIVNFEAGKLLKFATS